MPCFPISNALQRILTKNISSFESIYITLSSISLHTLHPCDPGRKCPTISTSQSLSRLEKQGAQQPLSDDGSFSVLWWLGGAFFFCFSVDTAKENVRSFPIFLDCGGVRKGKSPFRFENIWFEAEGFGNLVKSWWQNDEVKGLEQSRGSLSVVLR